ncbi:MAG: ABC transporter permease subunit [Dehalococcoidales bacterium]|nr:ABC transporter permease subunit [Dehalococcoidales bacterium]
MKNTLTIAGKELKSYLSSPMAYIVVCIFLALSGIFFSVLSSAAYYETSISGFLQYGSIVMLLMAAVITMRLISEEKKLGTLELLLTSPIRDSELIIGKYLGSLALLAIMLILTFLYPILLEIYGDPDVGAVVSGYLGMFLLGMTCLSIGIFASTLSSNQIVSAVVAGGILFALWFVGLLAGYLPEALANIVNYISLSYYFSDFVSGMVNTQGIVYYITISILFIFLAIRSIENSRWN